MISSSLARLRSVSPNPIRGLRHALEASQFDQPDRSQDGRTAVFDDVQPNALPLAPAPVRFLDASGQSRG